MFDKLEDVTYASELPESVISAGSFREGGCLISDADAAHTA